jgi:serine/threonine-protein kinase HipA
VEDSYRTAYVYVHDVFAGMLREIDTGYSFQYDNEYLNDPKSSSVSLTLPLQENIYLSKTLFAFFDGLIPEGWLLHVVVHNWKISSSDSFGILLVACRDCIGNVSIREVKE